MNYSYTEKRGSVKATYLIRIGGKALRIRATHMEILNFLRRLCAARSAA